MGVTTVIRVLFFVLFLLLFPSLVVVVSLCSRVVGLVVVGRVVGLVAAGVRQGLDWGGGNI